METDAPKKTSFTFELTNDQQELLLGLMVNGNFKKREVPYSLYSIAGEKFNATLYEKEKHGKRKLCVQGSGARDFIEFQLEPNGIVPVSLGYEQLVNPALYSAHAGSDESGKGDYFGPLVVACVYTDEKLSEAMLKLGTKDCKEMSDKAVLKTGAALQELLGPNGYAVVKIGPAAYNRLYAKIKNINRLLAWAHGTAIEELLTKRPDCPRIVVDQFAPTEATILNALKERGRKAVIEQHHKAESDIAVAAASVIARAVFLKEVAAFPLGSSDPRVRLVAEELVRKEGPVSLMNHCKAHFQTTDKVLAACGLTRAVLPIEGQIVSNHQPTTTNH